MRTVTARAGTGALLAALALAAPGAGCGGDSSAVGTGAIPSGDPTVSAPARPPQPPSVTGPTLVAAGDVACAPGERRTRFACNQADTARLVERQRPDVVAALGDLQYPAASLADFAGSFDASWGRFKARIRPVPGNHEYETPGAAGYFTYFGAQAGHVGEGWYSYDLGDWHVVALNANCEQVGCASGSPQLRWLRADLARHPTRCTLAYWHQPRFSSGLHGAEHDVDLLWRTLERAGAEVVLSGHDHDYERFAPQTADGGRDGEHGIVQFVVGGGGKSVYPIIFPRANSRARASTFGVLRLTLGPDAYAWRFVGEPGERFRDGGAARCH
jgi:3',5'-cyclic AMP phosphodiesterase CpdA